MKYAKGFTLIELMIVVAVIAILASIGIPAYGDYVMRGKLVDASAQLSDGRVKMEQFFQDNRTYAGGPCPATTKYFTFNCDDRTATTYTLIANGTGTVAGFTYSIDQLNTRVSNTPWGDGATCWVMRKGETC